MHSPSTSEREPTKKEVVVIIIITIPTIISHIIPILKGSVVVARTMKKVEMVKVLAAAAAKAVANITIQMIIGEEGMILIGAVATKVMLTIEKE